MVAFRQAEIRIVQIPPGEAPDFIRAAWVGLVLPLAAGHWGVSETETVGVISGKDEASVLGYAVEIEDAMAALALRSPEAAAWWRTHAPHLFQDGATLIFDHRACEFIDPE